MAKNEAPTIGVKLFVDKEKRKVLFAESDKEFVDVLFSFLTMPLGTIVRLLGKQSQVGCLDQMYKSVEDLSLEYFETKACKAMLLQPLNVASSHCRRLKINIDDTERKAVYVCKDSDCCAHADCAFTSFPGTVCKCGKPMVYVGVVPENYNSLALGPDGIFVKGLLKFIITDDLIVAPSSTSLMLSLFEKFGVHDPENIEETILQLTPQKTLSLLQRSLLSKQPLTGLYFDATIEYDDAELYVLHKMLVHPEQQKNADQKLNIAKIKILQTRNNSLLYAEADAEFIDLIFGLLTIPLGSIIKAFGQWPSNGCVDNLRKSIDGSGNVFMKSEIRSLLLAPKSAPFGCGANKVLQVDELAPTLHVNCCFKCLKIHGLANMDKCRAQYYYSCGDKVKSTILCELNPKAPKGQGGNGETYVKGGLMKFIVTDDLHVRPLSLLTTLQVLRDANVQTEDLEEREDALTKLQVMEIQRAALMGHASLSSVLLPPKNMAES